MFSINARPTYIEEMELVDSAAYAIGEEQSVALIPRDWEWLVLVSGTWRRHCEGRVLEVTRIDQTYQMSRRK